MKTYIFLFALMGVILNGCSHTPPTSGTDGKINHVVLIWLKDPGNTTQRQQIVEATATLEQIPGVIKIRTGEVIASERNIVDDSFDVGVHMVFSDKAAMQKYLSHPEHVRTINQVVQPLSQRILIYDFEQ